MLKVLTIFLSFVFALIFFELFLKYSPFEFGTSPVVYDKDIGFWHKRNYEGITVKKCYKNRYFFDNLGLPKSIVKYNRDKKDVILLGDSFVEALMIKSKNIIHNSLAKEFNYKYNFLNYGLFGTTPIQHFIILKKRAQLKNSKYLLHFINLKDDLFELEHKSSGRLSRAKVDIKFDTLDSFRVIEPRKQSVFDLIGDSLGDYQLYTFLKRVAKYITTSLKGIKESKEERNNTSGSNKKDLSKIWLDMEGSIHQINLYLKSKNIGYRVILFSTEDEKKRLHIVEFLKREKIKFILLDEVAKELNIQLNLYDCDKHWDNRAHQDIAKIIKKVKLIN